MRKILILLVITLILIMPDNKTFAYAVQNGYTPIKTVDNSNDSLVYFQSGISKGKINDFTGAIADFSKAVSTNENFVQAYWARGLAKAKIDDFSGAVEDFTRVIEIAPNTKNVYFMRGLSRKEMKDFNGAIQDLNNEIL